MNVSKLTDQKAIKKLTILFMFTYMISYITRTNFGAIISVYLLAPILILLSGWRAVFIFAAICGVIIIFVWNRNCKDVEIAPKAAREEVAKGGKNVLFTPHMFCIIFAIVLQGMLRDGVTTWMPSYISETYNLSSIISILTGVVLPIFSIISFQVTSRLYRSKFKNPLTCAGVIFGVGMFSALVLLVFTGKSAACSVLFSALLTACMHGVNLMLVCMLPAFFQKYGNVSTVSGVLNSCTYVGSAISTYGIAVISEAFSWKFTLFIWVLIAALGTIACFIASRKQL